MTKPTPQVHTKTQARVLAALPGTQRSVREATGLGVCTVWSATKLLLAAGAIRETGESPPGPTGKCAKTYCSTGLPPQKAERRVGKTCKTAALQLQNYFGGLT